MECSNCGRKYEEADQFEYCPRCGAEIVGGAGEEPKEQTPEELPLKQKRIPWYAVLRGPGDILIGIILIIISGAAAFGVEEFPYTYTDESTRFLMVRCYFSLLLALSFLVVVLGVLSIKRRDKHTGANTTLGILLVFGGFFVTRVGELISQTGAGDYMLSGFVLAALSAPFIIGGLIITAISIPAGRWAKRLGKQQPGVADLASEPSPLLVGVSGKTFSTRSLKPMTPVNFGLTLGIVGLLVFFSTVGLTSAFKKHEEEANYRSTTRNRQQSRLPGSTETPPASACMFAPVVSGDTVYAGKANTTYLYAFDAATGKEKWSHPTDGIVDKPVSVLEGEVYGTTNGGDYVFVLDAGTGAEKRRYHIVGGALTGPVIAEGMIYVVSGYTYLNALNAATGQPIWQFKTGRCPAYQPVVSSGCVYFTTEESGLYALDAATGTVKWIFKPTVAPGTQLELTSPATSVGNSIYVGAGVLDQRPGGWHGYVYCLDAQTGTEKSRLEMEGQCTSAPVLSEGVIFVSLGGFICALDVATGIQKWRSEVALSQTVIVSAVTVFTMSPRDVLALDAETGAVKWRFSGTDQINSLWGTPNLAMENGVVYAVGYPKYLYALDANTGQVRWQAAPAE